MTIKVQLNDIRRRNTWGGKEPINHSPAFDYCRKLIKDGADSNETLEVYRGDVMAYKIKNIGIGSGYKIREDKCIGPMFVKHEPVDEKAKTRFALIRRKKLQGHG